MKSCDLTATIPGVCAGASPPEPGPVWNDWPEVDEGIHIRWWSVHPLMVPEKQLTGDALDEFETTAQVCYVTYFSLFENVPGGLERISNEEVIFCENVSVRAPAPGRGGGAGVPG